ncbi:MAG: hypothetical protein RLZZ306_467, partial [Bacteroidota bacterium]
SKFKDRGIMLPVGTKIFQCSDKFWDSDTKFTERLVLTIEDKKNELTAVMN